MKRAEVWKNRTTDGWWSYVVWDGVIPTAYLPIPDRDDSGDSACGTWLTGGGKPTHAEALATVLAEVGLTEKNTREDPTR